MNLIVAVDNNFAIGYKNDLLYRIAPDMKQFRAKTLNKVVVMGVNTLLSFPHGNPLKNRVNIVLSTKYPQGEGYIIVRGLDELFKELENYSSEDIFVIGGAAVYRELLPYCEKAYITKIDAQKRADVYFPNLDNLDSWAIKEQSEDFEYEGISFKYLLYENLNVKKIKKA